MGTSKSSPRAIASIWSFLLCSSRATQLVSTKWKSDNCSNSAQVILPSLSMSVAVNRDAKKLLGGDQTCSDLLKLAHGSWLSFGGRVYGSNAKSEVDQLLFSTIGPGQSDQEGGQVEVQHCQTHHLIVWQANLGCHVSNVTSNHPWCSTAAINIDANSKRDHQH